MWWMKKIEVKKMIIMDMVIGIEENYRVYLREKKWMVEMIGKEKVELEIKIYKKREKIRSYWKVIIEGVIVGS